jgi:hypothetical protein
MQLNAIERNQLVDRGHISAKFMYDRRLPRIDAALRRLRKSMADPVGAIAIEEP